MGRSLENKRVYKFSKSVEEMAQLSDPMRQYMKNIIMKPSGYLERQPKLYRSIVAMYADEKYS